MLAPGRVAWPHRLRPVERALLATLARLDNPRFRADAWYLPAEPLLGFRRIPAGAFLMGSDPSLYADAYDRDQPSIPLIYRMSTTWRATR